MKIPKPTNWRFGLHLLANRRGEERIVDVQSCLPRPEQRGRLPTVLLLRVGQQRFDEKRVAVVYGVVVVSEEDATVRRRVHLEVRVDAVLEGGPRLQLQPPVNWPTPLKGSIWEPPPPPGRNST